MCAKGSTRCSGGLLWLQMLFDIDEDARAVAIWLGPQPLRKNFRDDTDNAEPIRVKDIYPTLKLNLCLRVPTRTGKSRSPSFVFDVDDCLTNQGVRGLFPQG
ncbi:hypothetical protein C8R47DRAFT_1080480 [Mycena vitilis]|nr:hypothetical protein C8R47DRAFT_1080480 [Mycena vitilis]